MNKTEVLIFDLFGTLVHFDASRVPMIDVAGRRVPMTVAGMPDVLARLLPGVSVEAFLRELRTVGAAVFEEKRREGIELHTSVRFERTLLALGADSAAAAVGGRNLATLHMDSLARAVVCPAGRTALLGRLAATHRLALLSNFDDGATARRVLAEAGLVGFFEVIVISEEEGLRKPARELFERTCARLATDPGRCLYIGDSLVEDIEGASAAGLAALWIRPGGDDGARSPAAAVLPDVDALPDWLAIRRAG